MDKREQWTTIWEGIKETIPFLFNLKEAIDEAMEHPLFQIGAFVGAAYLAIKIGKKILRGRF